MWIQSPLGYTKRKLILYIWIVYEQLTRIEPKRAKYLMLI